ncbi:hypothetical protein AB3X89_40735, partial [Paraburkholderia sp. BR14320]
LFAALNVLDGQVIGQCQQRHTHAEWLKFLRQIDRQTPKGKTLGSVAVRPTLKLGSEFLSCAMKKTKTPRTTLAPGLAKVLKRLH